MSVVISIDIAVFLVHKLVLLFAVTSDIFTQLA